MFLSLFETQLEAPLAELGMISKGKTSKVTISEVKTSKDSARAGVGILLPEARCQFRRMTHGVVAVVTVKVTLGVAPPLVLLAVFP